MTFYQEQTSEQKSCTFPAVFIEFKHTTVFSQTTLQIQQHLNIEHCINKGKVDSA